MSLSAGLDSALQGRLSVADMAIFDSPQNAIGVMGKGVPGLVEFRNLTVAGAGTFVLQIQAPLTASFTAVAASDVGFAPVYDCGSKARITVGEGNGQWLTTCSNSGGCPAAAANLTCHPPKGARGLCAHCGFPPPTPPDASGASAGVGRGGGGGSDSRRPPDPRPLRTAALRRLAAQARAARLLTTTPP